MKSQVKDQEDESEVKNMLRSRSKEGYGLTTSMVNKGWTDDTHTRRCPSSVKA